MHGVRGYGDSVMAEWQPTVFAEAPPSSPQAEGERYTSKTHPLRVGLGQRPHEPVRLPDFPGGSYRPRGLA